MHILHFIVSFEYIIFKAVNAWEGGIIWNVFQKGLDFLFGPTTIYEHDDIITNMCFYVGFLWLILVKIDKGKNYLINKNDCLRWLKWLKLLIDMAIWNVN